MICKLETQKSQWVASESQGVWDLRKAMFPFKSEGRKIPIEVSVQMQSESKEFLLLERGSAFLFYSGLQLIRGGPHTGGRAIYLPIQMFISSKNTLTHWHDTPSMTLTNIWVPHGPVKLTYKINLPIVLPIIEGKKNLSPFQGDQIIGQFIHGIQSNNQS